MGDQATASAGIQLMPIEVHGDKFFECLVNKTRQKLNGENVSENVGVIRLVLSGQEQVFRALIESYGEINAELKAHQQKEAEKAANGQPAESGGENPGVAGDGEQHGSDGPPTGEGSGPGESGEQRAG